MWNRRQIAECFRGTEPGLDSLGGFFLRFSNGWLKLFRSNFVCGGRRDIVFAFNYGGGELAREDVFLLELRAALGAGRLSIVVGMIGEQEITLTYGTACHARHGRVLQSSDQL